MAYDPNDPYAPPKPMAPVQPTANPYNAFRQNLQQRQQANLQQNIGGIQRRFAQMGGGPSGAQIKVEQQAQQQNAQDTAEGIGQINAQEAQQNFQANEAQRAFDRTQPMAQQVFDLEKSTKERSLALAERQGRLDEQGQIFNQALASIANKHGDLRRTQADMASFINMLDQQMATKEGEQFTFGPGPRVQTPEEARMQRGLSRRL